MGCRLRRLGDLARDHAGAVEVCRQVGRAVRRELGQALQPALGWDSGKFTAQAAARRTQPGRLLAVEGVRARDFLRPLPVGLLPLPADALQRLGFLGLRTLGQYAALPPAAVWGQFGRAGQAAQRYAQGKDERPVIPRRQMPHHIIGCDLDGPLVERERLLAALSGRVGPVLSELRGNLQAAGQARLAVEFEDGSVQERSRAFLLPTADEAGVLRALGQLLDQMRWPAGAVALTVTLEQIQDAVVEQLALFPAAGEPHRGASLREQKLRQVERYLAARFGAGRLRRAILAQPGAPLPEWRVGWLEEEGG